MAEPQFTAPPCAHAEAPASGVIHVRTRLTSRFTVIANALAQRPGSAVTLGVAAYILSLPDGAPVSIAALRAHFTEGEILISRALRELEASGYLVRRRERGPGGVIRTRTYVHDVPVREFPGATTTTTPQPAQEPEPEPEPPAPRPPRRPVPEAPAPAPAPAPAAPAPGAPDAPNTSADVDPQAVVLLASLRIADRRLVLSRREVDQLAPAVTRWLAQGIGPEQVTEALVSGLPEHFRARPARILAFRLRDQPLDVPAAAVPTRPPVLPWQTCDGGCERAFRAAQPGNCRDCGDCPPDTSYGEGVTDLAC